MTRTPFRRACIAAFTLLAATGAHAAPPTRLTASVDPLIGTAGGGNTYPGPSAPFGMVQFSPDTHAPSIGYDYNDKQIQGFSLTHMSGVGCDDYGDVFLTASTGPVQTDVAQYSSPFRHETEKASPGYYRVTLDKPGVDVELTATTRAGMARFTFPAGQDANILIPISHTLTNSRASHIRVVGSDTVEGDVTSQDFCGAPSTYTVYFVIQVDHPFQSFGTWAGGAPNDGAREAAQSDRDVPTGAYLRYPAGSARTVTARIGISFVDLNGARQNLRREITTFDFDRVRRQAGDAWEKELGRIGVDGGDAADRTKFYTSLYHCLLMPNVFDDADGRYRGFDDQIHTVGKGRHIYANFSGWDIYRTEFPLLTLIEPQRAQDMCQSIALMYRQGGWIDRWPQDNTYTNVMCGSPLTVAVATAWNAGLHDFDMTTAYEGMWKDATQPAPPNKPYGGESSIQYMNTLGYIPDDKEGYGSVSQTEEDCIAYAALAGIAQSLGKGDDAQFMTARALNYKRLFDPETRFLRPKDSQGRWLTPFDPTKEHGYVEGSGWHYRWLAPQDVRGLIQLFGGDDAFNTQLDAFMAYPHPTWDGRFYNPYNETDLQAPFLYDYSGAPSKTQSRVRELLADAYKTTPDGIPGNDDCGTMSAWYIFAAIGFYPTDPTVPAFELCSPLFTKVTLHLDKPYAGHTFTVEAPAASAARVYTTAVRLNGKTLNQPWFRESDLTAGGTLAFTLAETADPAWGTQNRPPSLTP